MTDPAGVDKSDDGGLVRPLGGFEADTLVPCGRTQQGEQSGHNTNTCTIELVDRARGWGRSSFIPCLSCAMSFYSVSFMNEGGH